LKLFRIPGKRFSSPIDAVTEDINKNSKKKPALFVHGFTSSSTFFVASGPALNETEQNTGGPEKWTKKGKALPY
jgi:hypothetical protein